MPRLGLCRAAKRFLDRGPTAAWRRSRAAAACRALWERVDEGSLAPEDLAYEMMTIEKGAAGQVRTLLTPVTPESPQAKEAA